MQKGMYDVVEKALGQGWRMPILVLHLADC